MTVRALVAVSVLSVCVVSPRLGAQQAPGRGTSSAKPGSPGAEAERPSSDAPSPWITNGMFKTSDVLGAPVVDASHVRVGKLDDVVVDLADGQVQVYVVALAPAADAAEAAPARLVAVPPGLLHVVTVRNAALTVPAAALDAARSFDGSAWPSLSDRAWIADAWERMGQAPTWPVKPAAKPASAKTAPAPWLGARVMHLAQLRVVNPAGADMGQTRELVLDMDKQRVAYTMVVPNSELGENDELYTVPWNAARRSDDALIVPLDADTWEDMPTFNAILWPDLRNAQWLSGVELYYRLHKLPAPEASEAPKAPKADAGTAPGTSGG